MVLSLACMIAFGISIFGLVIITVLQQRLGDIHRLYVPCPAFLTDIQTLINYEHARSSSSAVDKKHVQNDRAERGVLGNFAESRRGLLAEATRIVAIM
jgi:hypothetical protein